MLNVEAMMILSETRKRSCAIDYLNGGTSRGVVMNRHDAVTSVALC